MKKRENRSNVRQPEINSPEVNFGDVTIEANINDISGDAFTGATSLSIEEEITSNSPTPIKKEPKKNNIAPVKIDLEAKPSSTVTKGSVKSVTFLVIASILVLAVVATSLFYKGGLSNKFESPLLVGGKPVDSAEFSFMYHYILIDNGVDIFAAETVSAGHKIIMKTCYSGTTNWVVTAD